MKKSEPLPLGEGGFSAISIHMNGIFIIDKPEGITSHDVVQRIRKIFNVGKAGHLGTLDPIATGVLPICIGKATRLAQFLPSSPKEYTGEIRFGFSTNTYDREGSPASPGVPFDGTRDDILRMMESFTGVLDQVPPPFSAKKIAGVRSYKLARTNRTIEMAPVKVEIQQFELLSLDPPFAKFMVVCSAGTYVRSLVHDLGRKAGCGAHLTALRRTRSGDFRIEDARGLDRITEAELIPINRLLSSWPSIEVSESDESRVANGNRIRSACAADFARILNKRGEFIAVAAVESGWARPTLVLTSINSE